MRRLTLLLCVLAVAGCRSARRDRPPKRDYTSTNRTSIGFLKETFKSNAAVSRDSLKNTVSYSRRRDAVNRNRRESLSFLRESIFRGQISEAKRALRGVKRELTWKKDLWADARFGFLDTDKQQPRD